MVYCAYLALRQGAGTYQARKNTPGALEKAIHWDPANPQHYDALATLMHQYSDREDPAEVIRLSRTAVQASPMQADYWADLGAAYEWAGRNGDALRCFERARDLFPLSPDINWRLANFYVRDGKTGPAEVALQRALLGNPDLRRPAFALGWGATSNNQELLAHMIPAQADLLLSYLDFLIATKRLDAANQTWARLLDLHLSFKARDAFPYLDILIQANDPDRLEQAWTAMVDRFPEQLRPRAAYPNRIINGGFEFEILNGGLDWRVFCRLLEPPSEWIASISLTGFIRCAFNSTVSIISTTGTCFSMSRSILEPFIGFPDTCARKASLPIAVRGFRSTTRKRPPGCSSPRKI